MSYCGCTSIRINHVAKTDAETMICPDCVMMLTPIALCRRLARQIADLRGGEALPPLLPVTSHVEMVALTSHPPFRALGAPAAGHAPSTAPAGYAAPPTHVPASPHVPVHLPGPSIFTPPGENVAASNAPNRGSLVPIYFGEPPETTPPAKLVPPGEARWFEAKSPFDCRIRRFDLRSFQWFEITEFRSFEELFPAEQTPPAVLGDETTPQLVWTPPKNWVWAGGHNGGFVALNKSAEPRAFYAVLYVEPVL